MSTKINARISINGKVGVPVGGVTESVIVGNVEILMQLNDDGTLNAHVFNRENDINYIGEGIGYTQGLGLTYNVEFDTFKEMIRKIFTRRREKSDSSNSNNNAPDTDSDLPPEYLEYINERRPKKVDTPKTEPTKVPEIE